MGELPTGTVTFVFTDIEGSTRLLHRLPRDYERALQDHRRIVREAFSSCGGVEVDTQGDAFFVAFPTAAGAVEAAARAQRALADHGWPQQEELRVRMGIHSGEPVLTQDGYVGADVHLGAASAPWPSTCPKRSTEDWVRPRGLAQPLGYHPGGLHRRLAGSLARDWSSVPAMRNGGVGHGILINGIQSSGKSSVAGRLAQETTTFRVLTGDDVVRAVPQSQRVRLWKQLFAMTLEMIETWLQTSNVIIDGAWTQEQVREAQDRFGDAGLYVVLRIDEQERRRRELRRTDRQIAYWDPSWHQMPGPDEMYDLVIDSRNLSIGECAERILEAAKDKWSDLTT